MPKRKSAPIGNVPRRSSQIFFALLRSEVTSEALSLAKPLKSSLSRVSASPSDPQAARPIDCALSENNFHKHCNHFQAVLEHNGLDHHQQQ